MPAFPPAIDVQCPGIFVFSCPMENCRCEMWSPDLVTIVRAKHAHLESMHGERYEPHPWLKSWELAASVSAQNVIEKRKHAW